jgi:hypothetical protein
MADSLAGKTAIIYGGGGGIAGMTGTVVNVTAGLVLT